MVSLGSELRDRAGQFVRPALQELAVPVLGASQSVVVERFADGLNRLHRPLGVEVATGFVCAHLTLSTSDGALVPISVDGLKRTGDETIEARVSERLSRFEQTTSTSFRPVRILELGAGTSYPGDATDVGGPWLARSLKMQFAERIDIRITDGTGPKNSSLIELVNDRGRHLVRTLPASKLLHPSEICRDQFGPRFASKWHANGDPARVVRPSLDPVFEREVFGIEVLAEIDLRRPHRYPAACGFDVIFARHQHPTAAGVGLNPLNFLSRLSGSGWETIARRIGRCLNPGGIAILNVDNPLNKSTTQYRVAPDGSSKILELQRWDSCR